MDEEGGGGRGMAKGGERGRRRIVGEFKVDERVWHDCVRAGLVSRTNDIHLTHARRVCMYTCPSFSYIRERVVNRERAQ